MIELPINRFLPEIRETLARSGCLVLQASPGSGKTTRVPPYLLENTPGEILILEPRRVAAKYAARRVSSEMGVKLGQEVGYQFRFENVTSARTRLRFLTEGMLMRKLLGDPTLRGVSTVIIDEFHERHLHGDVALAFLKNLQSEKRPDLKIVVMSATLDTQSVSQFLNQCPSMTIDAPIHPVKVEYLKSALSKRLEYGVKDAVTLCLESGEEGDILVFLPGMGDIRRSEEQLQELARVHGFLVTPLHGDLTREEQERAIEKASRRKVILSTNLAETSLTIEGVSVVIDSGLHRQASYSWWSGVPTLKTKSISKASAIQRAGRAGRTRPGVCYRLYTRGEFDSRPRFDTPEIQRSDLAQTTLELKNLGIEDLSAFEWFESPSSQSLKASEMLLEQLGAIENSSVTELGARMVEFPAHPRVSRILLEAAHQGVSPKDISLFGALISESEFGAGIDAIESFERLKHSPLPQNLKKLSETFQSQLKETQAKSRGIGFCVLTGFPDRVAKKRSSNDKLQTETELLLSAGGSVKCPNSGVVLNSDYFVVLDIQEKQALGQARAQLQIKSLIEINPDWLLDLPPSLVKETDELSWDPQKKRIRLLSQIKYGELVLSESATDPRADSAHAERASLLLFKSAFGIDLGVKQDISSRIKSLAPLTDVEAFESSWVRLELYRKFRGEKAPTTEDLDRFLIAQSKGFFSISEISEVPWSKALLADTDRIDQWFPTHFELPNKRRAEIHYRLESAPWIESRLQDFFGVKSPPSLAQGKIPLTLHLLAPNYRALQVTTDLPGFWARTYPEVRKELSRKYPRHSWPENPFIAEPIAIPPRRNPK